MNNDSYIPPSEQRLLSRFWQSARGFWSGATAPWAWLLTVLLIATVLLQLLTQYTLNFWNRDFFNAVERKDGAELLSAGMAIPAAGRGQPRARGVLGLGPHDPATEMARVAEQPPLQILAGARPLCPAQIHAGGASSPGISHRRGRQACHRPAGRPRARAFLLADHRHHLYRHPLVGGRQHRPSTCSA